MSLRLAARAWNRFFFKPQPPTPVAVFRIFYGLLIFADLVLLRPDWQTWYGPHSVVSLSTMQSIEAGVRLNVFSFLPPTAFWADAVFWVMIAAALMLTAGFLTRLSSIAVFCLLVSLHQRNLMILNSGDTLLRSAGFFLIFAPAGAAFSVDRWIRRRGQEGTSIPDSSPWAQRIIQIQVALVYLITFWNKSMGQSWIDGTAVHYVHHLDQFTRFPVPAFFLDPFVVTVETWATLAIEFALGVLIWFKELRNKVLFAGLLLHLSLEYSMNVPLFQWIMLAGLVTFVYPADLARAHDWLRARLRLLLPNARAARSAPASLAPSTPTARYSQRA